LINMFNILTGFTYRGLSPHKFTPVPGVHKQFQPIKTVERGVRLKDAKNEFHAKKCRPLGKVLRRLYIKVIMKCEKRATEV